MSSLYKISSDLISILSQVEESEGELTPELENQLAITEAELSNKVIAYNHVVNSLSSDTLAIDAEIERLKKLKASKEKVVDKLKSVLLNTLLEFGVNKPKGGMELNFPTLTLTTRKSQSVSINGPLDSKYLKYDVKLSNLSLIQLEYIRAFLNDSDITFTLSVKESKTLIKEDIDNGINVLNASIENKYNLVIK